MIQYGEDQDVKARDDPEMTEEQEDFMESQMRELGIEWYSWYLWFIEVKIKHRQNTANKDILPFFISSDWLHLVLKHDSFLEPSRP